MVSIGQTLNLGQPINPACPLNKGLVSRWQVINQGPYSGGGRLLDLAGRYHGTLVNSPTRGGALGRPGGWGAVSTVTASVNYVRASTTAFNPSTAAFSFGGWAISGAAGTQTVFSLTADNDEGQDAISIHTRTGPWGVEGYGAGTAPNLNSTITPVLGTWYHVFYTWNGSNSGTLYIDGNANASNATAPQSTTVARFHLGAFSVTYPGYTGTVDDARVFDRELSASTVAAIYQDSRQGSPLTLNWLRRPTVFDTGGGAAATAYESQITRSVAITRSNSY